MVDVFCLLSGATGTFIEHMTIMASAPPLVELTGVLL